MSILSPLRPKILWIRWSLILLQIRWFLKRHMQPCERCLLLKLVWSSYKCQIPNMSSWSRLMFIQTIKLRWKHKFTWIRKKWYPLQALWRNSKSDRWCPWYRDLGIFYNSEWCSQLSSYSLLLHFHEPERYSQRVWVVGDRHIESQSGFLLLLVCLERSRWHFHYDS